MIVIKKVLILLLMLFMLICSFFAFGGGINEASEQYAGHLLKSNAAASLYSVLTSEIAKHDTSSVITQIKSDGITMLHIDSSTVNELTASVLQKANEAMRADNFCEINILWGNLSGIKILSGKGRNIKIKAVPVGNAVGDIKSDMISAGINQTRYRMTLTVNACMALMYPFEKCVCNISVDILICETVIVGSVPEVVFG